MQTLLFSAFFLLIAFGACTPTHDVLRIDIRRVVPLERPTHPTHAAAPVEVLPLVDRRQPDHPWFYIPNWGPPVPITVHGTLRNLVTLSVIDYLNRHEGWDTWLAAPALPPPSIPAQFRLTGTIEEWQLEAHDYLANTKMTISTKLTFTLIQLSTNESWSYVIPQTDSHWIVPFDSRHIESAIYETFMTSMNRFLQYLHQDVNIKIRTLTTE